MRQFFYFYLLPLKTRMVFIPAGRWMSPFLVGIAFCLIAACSESPSDSSQPLPEGYQQDIPWPSLADSPWPMFGADPQNTNRSKGIGPFTGFTEVYIDTLFMKSGITLDKDSTVYFLAGRTTDKFSGLYALNFDGTIKWRFPAKISDDQMTPLIASDGTIYFNSLIDGKFYALKKDGSIKWQIENLYSGMFQMNIGLDGTLYFIDSKGELIAINPDGDIIWTFNDIGLADGLSFSPDGKTLYLQQGLNGHALIAFDLSSRTIKWFFGKSIPGGGFLRPLINNDGNIYIGAIASNDSGTVYHLNSEGQILWSFKPKPWGIHGGFEHFALDKRGNLYFGYDQLFALSHKGELKWTIGFDSLSISSDLIVSDKIIYFTIGKGIKRKILGVTDTGQIILNVNVPAQNEHYGTWYAFAVGFNALFLPEFEGKSIYIIK